MYAVRVDECRGYRCLERKLVFDSDGALHEVGCVQVSVHMPNGLPLAGEGGKKRHVGKELGTAHDVSLLILAIKANRLQRQAFAEPVIEDAGTAADDCLARPATACARRPSKAESW